MISWSVRIRNKEEGRRIVTYIYLPSGICNLKDAIEYINNPSFYAKDDLKETVDSGKKIAYLTRLLELNSDVTEESLLQIEKIDNGINVSLLDGKFIRSEEI